MCGQTWQRRTWNSYSGDSAWVFRGERTPFLTEKLNWELEMSSSNQEEIPELKHHDVKWQMRQKTFDSRRNQSRRTPWAQQKIWTNVVGERGKERETCRNVSKESIAGSQEIREMGVEKRFGRQSALHTPEGQSWEPRYPCKPGIAVNLRRHSSEGPRQANPGAHWPVWTKQRAPGSDCVSSKQGGG